MLWFWFTIGLIITLFGAFTAASDTDLEIKNYSFDSETLGYCMLTIGGVLAGSMLFALGIQWFARGC